MVKKRDITTNTVKKRPSAALHYKGRVLYKIIGKYDDMSEI
jgi:hypothetical protein